MSFAAEEPVVSDAPLIAVLERARREAQATGVSFAGSVTPPQAWALFRSGAALLVDVRSAEERKFVGHVPGSHHVAWASGTHLTRNPRFVHELETKAGKDAVVLLLCRSGRRSMDAAAAAASTGFANAFSVQEGFEGERDDSLRRGALGGWRFHGLPWIQD